MLSIQISQFGKRFNREWIFRNLNLSIAPSEKLVITGANGSGKSTLLLMLSGYVLPTEGEITWKDVTGNIISPVSIHKNLSLASPAMELIEEFNPIELIKHQRHFKKFQVNWTESQILELCMLSSGHNKSIKYFSSGMKQRLKLALAVLSNSSLLLLDEPIINLDKSGIAWYKDLISKYGSNKTIIVCSNKILEEYEFCTKEISIDDYKMKERTK